MYRIFTYIYHENQPNVGKYTYNYTIHGSYDIYIYILPLQIVMLSSKFCSDPPERILKRMSLVIEPYQKMKELSLRRTISKRSFVSTCSGKKKHWCFNSDGRLKVIKNKKGEPTSWKAKYPILKARVAGFRGKVASKNRILGVPG